MTTQNRVLRKPATPDRSPRRNGLLLFIAQSGYEIVLFLVGIGLLLVALALVSHSPNDPAWSTTGTGASVQNWLGEPGALLANVVYFAFGFSGIWLYVLGWRMWWHSLQSRLSLRPSEADDTPTHAVSQVVIDWLRYAPVRRLRHIMMLCLLLCASTVLEWMYLHTYETWLPDHAGGILGRLLGPWLIQHVGFSGVTILGIVALLTAVAGVFRFSWLRCAEVLGLILDHTLTSLHGLWQSRQDARIGREALRHRESEPALDGNPVETATTQPPLTPTASAAAPSVSAQPIDFNNSALNDVVDDLHDAPATAVDARLKAIDNVFAAATEHSHPTPVSSSLTPQPHRRPPTNAAFQLPDLDVLTLPDATVREPSPHAATEALEATSRLIEQTLKNFGIGVKVVAATPGPVVTRYEFEPATGVKGAQIVNLVKDLARALRVVSIRVLETVPGKHVMALELPNAQRQIIHLSAILSSAAFQQSEEPLLVALGQDIVGQPVVADLAAMPHCLIAGTTGSGKSVGIHAMLLSLLCRTTPEELRLMLIDPKMLEMSIYDGIPHLLCPVVTDAKQATRALQWCVTEMDRRYKLMSKLGVRHLAAYNRKIEEAQAQHQPIPNPTDNPAAPATPLQRLPAVVVVIDELADLMITSIGKTTEDLIGRLTQKARAAGIHLILATQRPSVDVITGFIKANIPTRLSFQVSSKIDSRTILEQTGAEALLGMGDMLYMPNSTSELLRVHGAFVSDEDIHRVVAHLKAQPNSPRYIEGLLDDPTPTGLHTGQAGGVVHGFDIGIPPSSSPTLLEKDPLYDQAVALVLRERQTSIPYLQQQLQIDPHRCMQLLSDMERAGLITPANRHGQRNILVPQRF